jgi:hypothetical protein
VARCRAEPATLPGCVLRSHWRDVGGVSSARVWLTPEEAAEVEQTVGKLIDQYRTRSADDHPEGARWLRVGFLLFPTDEPPAKR